MFDTNTKHCQECICSSCIYGKNDTCEECLDCNETSHLNDCEDFEEED